MNTPLVLIDPATAAGQSEALAIGQNATFSAPAVPVTFMAWGFADPADAVALEFSPDGVAWVAAKVGGVAVVLDQDTNLRTIYGPGLYRLNKGVTVGEVGAAISMVKGVQHAD